MKLLDKIRTFDDVLSEEQFFKVEQYLSSFGWGKHYSDPDYPENFFWNLPGLEREFFFKNELLAKIEDLTKRKYKLERVYANAQTFGLDGFFHYDAFDETGFTFLIYMNREWKFEWGGETVFIDRYYDNKSKTGIENSKEFKVYLPKPNCALFFPGIIYHYGRSPNRSFNGVRYTLAFKLLTK